MDSIVRSSIRYEGSVRAEGWIDDKDLFPRARFVFNGSATKSTGPLKIDKGPYEPLKVSVLWYPESHSFPHPPIFAFRDGKTIVTLELEGNEFAKLVGELSRLCEIADELDVSFTVVEYTEEAGIGPRIDDLMIGKRVRKWVS